MVDALLYLFRHLMFFFFLTIRNSQSFTPKILADHVDYDTCIKNTSVDESFDQIGMSFMTFNNRSDELSFSDIVGNIS